MTAVPTDETGSATIDMTLVNRGTMPHADIPLEHIRWKIQASSEDKTKSLYVPYADARAVAEALDRAVGWDRWSDEYRVEDHDAKVWVICAITVHTATTSITKTDMAEATDFEAVKGGASDAFKRAAVKFGVGRNLYALPSIWAPSEVHRGRAVAPRNIEAVLWQKVAQLGHQVPEPSDHVDVVEVDTPKKPEQPKSTAAPFVGETPNERATKWAKRQFFEMLGQDADVAQDEYQRAVVAAGYGTVLTDSQAYELVARLNEALAEAPRPEGAPG